MKQRIITSTSLLFLATPFCFANGYTLAVANNIIVILMIIVIALIVIGGYSLYHNRIISQRNEQLRRILTALDDYRAIVGDEAMSLDEQEKILTKKLSKSKEGKVVQKGEEQSFFVKMDATPVSTRRSPSRIPISTKMRWLSSWASVMRRSANWCRVILIPTGRLTISTPYGRNMLLSYSWSILTARQRRLCAGVVSRILQHTKAPLGSPSASYLRSMYAA